MTKENIDGVLQRKPIVRNFEKYIDNIAAMIRDGGGCAACPVFKDSCGIWGDKCAEAFKNWALADSDDMSMATTKLVQTARMAARDNMYDILQQKKMMG